MEVNANYDSLDGLIARPQLPFVSPVVGATTTLDLSLGRAFAFTCTQATTLALTNTPASLFVRVWLKLTNGSAFLITWPASVVWLVGSAPVFKASGVDRVALETYDGGTTWYALHPVHVLYQAQKVTTTSAVDGSLASYTLPGGSLVANAQALRITLAGAAVPAAGGATVNIKFGAGSITAGALAIGANDVFLLTALLTRTGAATQWANYGVMKAVAPLAGANSATLAETLANPILIDFRGNVAVGGQTLTYDSIQVEYLRT